MLDHCNCQSWIELPKQCPHLSKNLADKNQLERKESEPFHPKNNNISYIRKKYLNCKKAGNEANNNHESLIGSSVTACDGV